MFFFLLWYVKAERERLELYAGGRKEKKMKRQKMNTGGINRAKYRSQILELEGP